MNGPDRTRLPIRRARVRRGDEPDARRVSARLEPHRPPEAPEGAPNVLLVLIDDAGFGAPSTFGGPIETPSLTRMADGGLKYNRFHVTALCSPTRAAMLTGRNHHAVGFGQIGELSSGYPGYCALVPKDCAPFPRILKENGYATGAFGKWHLTPDAQQGPAGPFDRWPNGWGFDYFWGFLGGEAGQYDPVITQNQSTIGVPEGKAGEPYYFPDDMADKTIEWIHGVRAQDPDKPWFAYFSTGCAHAPHHVPKEWADKYKGKFDQGWDALREETFARQKALGVIPADAELTPRNEAFPAWDSLPEDLRKLYARQMEVYAGFQENADWNVGRVLDAIEEMGELDDTVVIYIWGDNGASMEGTLTGSFNELTMQNGIPLTSDQQLALIDLYGGLDAWGTELTAPHCAAAWAWASNAPFQWGKQVASHLGGTRNPMVIHWPARINDGGAVRSHFTHCIDIGPTILDIAGIPVPTHVDGIEQQPMHGVTFADSIDDPAAPERHTQQYFEIVGYRGMYKDGWWLSMMPPRIPWDLRPDAIRALAPGVWDPEDGRDRALLPPGRLLAEQGSRRAASGQGRRVEGAVLGGGREVPGAAAARRPLRVLRHVAAARHTDPIHLLRRRPEHCFGDDPADLQPVLRDLGGSRDSRGRRGGCHRRGGGSLGWLLAVRRGRQAEAHVLDDGRPGLSAGVRRIPPHRRGDAADGVRGRLAHAGDGR